MERAEALTLVMAIAIPVLGGVGVSLTVGGSVKGWYKTLRKPTWTPPNWLFGPMWTTLYVMMGVASWLVWKKGGFSAQQLPLGLYAVHLVANFAWTPLFFGLHKVGAALGEILILWGMIVGLIVTFTPVIGPQLALPLLLPYLAWVTVATALTYTIWVMNPPQYRTKSEGKGRKVAKE